MMMSIFQPLVVSYNNFDACKCDNYTTLPKETPMFVQQRTAFLIALPIKLIGQSVAIAAFALR